MCGIVGLVNGHPVATDLVAALGRLEYRGYDSAGLALTGEGALTVRKVVGRTSQLTEALGATPRIILRQFLVEASLLGLVGGLAGLGLGMLGGVILPRVVNFPVAISPVAAAAGLGVSLIIGITAGVYPASRAARLAPIEALRSE